MTIPPPEPGLVISYSYLWHHEHRAGLEEGRKDRPCVVVLAVTRAGEEGAAVVVLPVTHRQPDNAAAGVEIPPAVKKHLGLDAERSWVIVDEGNRFEWPGYDLRRIPGRVSRFHYGFLPPRLFNEIVSAFAAWHQANKRPLTPR